MRLKLNGFVTDTKVIVDETLNILLAGRDTVSIFPLYATKVQYHQHRLHRC